MNTGSPDKEDTAIVAITRRGAALGRRLRQLLPGSRLYLPEKLSDNPGDGESPYSAVKDVVTDIFRRYRNMVLIMATGSAVRLLADEVRDKHHDPAVVTVDDAGTFAISLLSGHIGGANALAEKVALLLDAQPVITTASDVGGTIAMDLLGREFGWKIEDDSRLTLASAALVNGEPVGVYQDAGEPDWWHRADPLPDNITVYPTLEGLQKTDSAVAVLITDRLLDETLLHSLPDLTLIYRPKSLVLGIGCNRGTTSEAIEAAVVQALSDNELSPKCIRAIATIDLKKDEAGLLEFARAWGLPVEYHAREALRETGFPSAPSAAALRHAGTPSVCEAAALLSSRASGLLVPKAGFGRAVTVAVARYSFAGSPQTGKGTLFLVGTGPGDLKQMTFAARDAIDRSEVVIGYRTYLDLIKPLLQRKQVVATGMGDEVARVKNAIDLARQGRKVALISSGDSGIYGMAGLAGEILREQPSPKIDIVPVPGVPALAAAAALLGSPISGDFAAISLSDYLVPWAEICRRLEAAGRENFVTVLYNPQSHRRRQQLVEAREIILRHRPPTTPAGIVTNAYRPGQEVAVTDLEHLPDHDIGMNTTVIIGNRDTFVSGGRMVTPRGYGKKYQLGQEQP
ncbi:MAG: precorrin-3B C(17)-methyltransferase [Chloroflexota bacterium]